MPSRLLPVFGIIWFCLSFPICAVELEANAAGYVDATVCGSCHQSHASGFQHVGMSQSFGEIDIKWFTPERLKGLPFHHAASNRYYDIQLVEGKVLFVRYQLDEQGERINQITVPIDYFLGSGNKAVAFLFRTHNDELYHLPINWYAEPGFWEMAPGYELARHYGLSKKILRECMFCHNAYPQEQMANDLHWQRDTFPPELKNGIDCQRCHGPGQNHVETVNDTKASLDMIRSSIVNPVRLEPKARDSVCLQCHLLPSVSMSGQRRFDRSDYSFRPGDVLSDYILHVDVTDDKIPQSERFEINHHGYRLMQSACFTQSESQLTCISCHNPHQKPEKQILHEKVEGQCRQCHEKADVVHTSVLPEEKSCVSCHMPQRRSQDVVHTVMTDHKIGIYPDIKALTQPLSKQDPSVIDMDLFDKNLDMAPMEQDIYKLVSILQTFPTTEYANNLKSRLIQLKYPHLRPYIVLVEAQLTLEQNQEALASLNFMKRKFGNNLRIAELLATANVAAGRYQEAEAGYKWLLGITSTGANGQSADNGNADVYFNYGLLKYKLKAYQEAFSLFQKASLLRGNFAIAIMYQAITKESMGETADAIRLFQASLDMEPLLDRSYHHLINLLHEQNMKAQARKYYQLAMRNVQDMQLIQQISQSPDKRYLQGEK